MLTVNLNEVSVLLKHVRHNEMPVGLFMDINREMWHWFSPWYLNGENGRGGQRFDSWCYPCFAGGMKPLAKQRSAEHHKHHMHRVHGGNTFYRNLSLDDKRRAILGMFEFRKAHDAIAKCGEYELECYCPLSEIELQNSYINEMHHMIADHVAMTRCPDCKLVMRATLLDGHQ